MSPHEDDTPRAIDEFVQPSETEPAIRLKRYSADATGDILEITDEEGTVIQGIKADGALRSANGGSVPGAVTVHKLAFAFGDAGLNAGLTVYTPAVDDILLDAWIEVGTAWDGTTPVGDFGQPVINANGYFGALVGGIDMTSVDISVAGANSLLVAEGPATNVSLVEQSSAQAQRVVPGKFRSVSPLKVWVSQTGNSGGAAPGASQGAAVAYVVVSTPTT